MELSTCTMYAFHHIDIWYTPLTLILSPGAISVFVNLFYLFRVEIINQNFWENLTFTFYSLIELDSSSMLPHIQLVMSDLVQK